MGSRAWPPEKLPSSLLLLQARLTLALGEPSMHLARATATESSSPTCEEHVGDPQSAGSSFEDPRVMWSLVFGVSDLTLEGHG